MNKKQYDGKIDDILQEAVLKMRGIPTVAELIALGYKVDVTHFRNYKIANMGNNKKLVILTACHPRWFVETESLSGIMFYELLACGGRTEITVTCPDSKLEFFGGATCRSDENFNKKEGVKECLKRIVDLMRVVEAGSPDKDGVTFKMKCDTVTHAHVEPDTAWTRA
jgi:hypothetical protein